MSGASAEVVAISDGSWYVMRRGAHAPHRYAHRLVDVDAVGKWGERWTVCGLSGQPIAVGEGVRVYPCPRCEPRS
jgi:hypothetical protein